MQAVRLRIEATGDASAPLKGQPLEIMGVSFFICKALLVATGNLTATIYAAAAAAAATAPEAVATPAAAATTATVGHLVSCRQGDGKHNPQPSLRRCSKGSHARWYKRSATTDEDREKFIHGWGN